MEDIKSPRMSGDVDKSPPEHKVPFGDKTLCVLIMEKFTAVPGVIKDLNAYAGHKTARDSAYERIPADKRPEAKQAVVDYFSKQVANIPGCFEAVTRNIQFW